MKLFVVSALAVVLSSACVKREFNSNSDAKSTGDWHHTDRFIARSDKGQDGKYKNGEWEGAEIWLDYIPQSIQAGSFLWESFATEIYAHVSLPRRDDCLPPEGDEGFGEVVLTSYVTERRAPADTSCAFCNPITVKGLLKADGLDGDRCKYTVKLEKVRTSASGKEIEVRYAQRMSVVLKGTWLFDGGGSKTNDFNFTMYNGKW
jgi:hypothetical protein